MRFYIPGTVTKKEEGDEQGEGEENKSADGEEEVEEQNAANLFYETLMDKAEIGDVAGDTFATFLDVLHLTPRFVWRLSFGIFTMPFFFFFLFISPLLHLVYFC